MSTVARLAAVPRRAGPALRVTPLRVLKSEFTKFRSLRSSLWTMLAGVVLVIGLGALISAITASQHHAPGPPGRAAGGAVNPVSTSLAGITFAVIAFGVLGVMFSSGEYSTGMIRSSLTVVPRRLPVLWAKLAVFAAAIFPVSLIASASAFFVGQALLTGHHLGVSISSPGALRSVIGAALYVTVAGMIGVALGALLRSTAAGIATFAAVFFVVPPLTALLPASVSSDLAQYLPTSAGDVLWGGATGVTNALAPWTGFALLCGYALVLVGAAAWRLVRTDA